MDFEQLSLDITGIKPENALTDRQTDRQTDRDDSLSVKIEKATQIIRLASSMSKEFYKKPLVLTYSGGKDSDVLLRLAENCLEPNEYMVLNSHTSVDAPQTVYHIRKTFKRLNEMGVKTVVHQPKDDDGNPITMWNLIPKKKIPPSRMVRYCCEVLKEASTPNSLSLTGVREAESKRREGRDIFNVSNGRYQYLYYSYDHAEEVFKESMEIQDDNWDCTLIKSMKEKGTVTVTPIYYWSDFDIWDFIRQEKIDYNPLYDEGLSRIGCVMCPLATRKNMQREMQLFPQYKKLYISAFDRMLKARKDCGKNDKYHNNEWNTGEDVFDWYVGEHYRNCQGQMSMFEE